MWCRQVTPCGQLVAGREYEVAATNAMPVRRRDRHAALARWRCRSCPPVQKSARRWQLPLAGAPASPCADRSSGCRSSRALPPRAIPNRSRSVLRSRDSGSAARPRAVLYARAEVLQRPTHCRQDRASRGARRRSRRAPPSRAASAPTARRERRQARTALSLPILRASTVNGVSISYCTSAVLATVEPFAKSRLSTTTTFTPSEARTSAINSAGDAGADDQHVDLNVVLKTFVRAPIRARRPLPDRPPGSKVSSGRRPQVQSKGPID